MDTNITINTVRTQIERSVLLTDDRKQALFAILETLSGEQIESLHGVLLGEAEITDALLKHAIETLVAKKDTQGIKALEILLKTSERSLRKADEESDRIDENQTISNFFDAV